MSKSNSHYWKDIYNKLEKASESLSDTSSKSSESKSDILQERARKIAAKVKPPDTSDASEFTLFSLANETYALESGHIVEVYPLKTLTLVPGTPSYVSGIISVRGQINSVLDLKVFFNLPSRGLTDLTRVIIISNNKMRFGILAEDVIGTEVIKLNSIKKPPSTLKGKQTEYLKGVTSGRIVILDAEKLLNDENIIVNQ